MSPGPPQDHVDRALAPVAAMRATNGDDVRARRRCRDPVGERRADDAAQRLVEPGEVLERVNEQLCPDMPEKMFVTCLYGVLDPRIRYD